MLLMITSVMADVKRLLDAGVCFCYSCNSSARAGMILDPGGAYPAEAWLTIIPPTGKGWTGMPAVWIRFGDKRDYPIVVDPGVLAATGTLVKKRVQGKTACLVSHPRIHRLYGKIVEGSLRRSGMKILRILVPEGETTKTLGQVEGVIGQMLHARLDRASFIVALGGGVVGDLAGLAAAIYMRGIEFIQIPTTLLAQVDSSVGGKVGVNHAQGKNLIGAFLQPRLVITDPQVLKTLTARQLRSGLAEMIKAGIIADSGFFRQMEEHIQDIAALDMKWMSTAIARSCRIKGRIVEKDEREKGLRAILNYGHTFGHALEAYHQYRGYTHGEAVALGMAIAAHLALLLGLCKTETVSRQISLLRQAGLPVKGKREELNRIESLMKVDKKASEGKNKFVLTPHIGHARIVKQISSFSVHRVLKAVLGSA
ncbi:3-dehydroquinate synthase [candidate division FCPU426 bacterium]|nr:3-dehydroquinate synthase [candidate division FCPU426 bacterium]